MGSAHERRFWSETERYHDLAVEYERNIEITHPDFVTSDRVACNWCRRCPWAVTAVVYREHRGPSV